MALLLWFERFKSPFGVAVSNDGRILVTDYLNHRVQVFTNDGQFLFKFGSSGSEPGLFKYPDGIVVDEYTGFIFVADYDNKRIQIFRGDGLFQREIKLESYPIGIVIDRNQRLIVGECDGRISIF